MARRSVFDGYTGKSLKPPRLRPNVFARLARFSFRHPIITIVLWFVVSAAILAAGLWDESRLTQLPLDYTPTSQASKNLAALNENFPNLNSLIAISISNANPDSLKHDRARLVAAIEDKTENFELAFSPGSGHYYDTHGMLYLSLDEVKTRVAYAKSLHPLFVAIAASPTTSSLATLVNEVSGSIELGRDPQGLDDLFSESAKSIQALMQGTERPVDWTVVAGLNLDAQPTSALVFALPKLDRTAEALDETKDIISALKLDGGTTTVVDQAAQQERTIAEASPPRNRIIAIMTMAAIFLVIALAALLGQTNLAIMVMAPVIATEAIAIGLMLTLIPNFVLALWPVLLGLGIATVQLSTRFSFAILDALRLARAKESAVMLAGQRQGRGLLWLSILMAVTWCSWFAMESKTFAILAAVVAVSSILGLLCIFMVAPAIVRLTSRPLVWRAGSWLMLLHEGSFINDGWRSIGGYLAVAATCAAAAGVWFSPTLLRIPAERPPLEAAVNILAATPQEAEALVGKLKSIPQAQSARWLGAFLPLQAKEKLAVLKELKDLFPRVTPLIPQDPDMLREHVDTLQESLKTISDSTVTRAELRAVAVKFRQSLAVLAATSGNQEVMALENRIFGSFNVLPDRAEAFATLGEPSLETLDPRLRTLFLSNRNVFRLEVSPAAGLSNAELARVLAANQFPVAHPVLVQDENTTNQKRGSLIVLSMAITLGLCIMAFAVGERGGFLATAVTFAAALGVLASGAKWFNVDVTPQDLPALISIVTYTLSLLIMAFVKQQVTREPLPEALHVTEIWLPVVMLVALISPVVFLRLDPYAPQLAEFLGALGAVTITVAVLLRPLTRVFRTAN